MHAKLPLVIDVEVAAVEQRHRALEQHRLDAHVALGDSTRAVVGDANMGRKKIESTRRFFERAEGPGFGD